MKSNEMELAVPCEGPADDSEFDPSGYSPLAEKAQREGAMVEGGRDGYVNNPYYQEAYGKLQQGHDAEEQEGEEDKRKPQPRIAIRDWNREFQSILSAISRSGEDGSKLDRYNMLSSLAHDFLYVAKVYGKIIILERFLPSNQKTIKPVNIGVRTDFSGLVLFGIAIDAFLLNAHRAQLAEKSTFVRVCVVSMRHVARGVDLFLVVRHFVQVRCGYGRIVWWRRVFAKGRYEY